MAKTLFVALKSGVVVDRSVLVTLSSAELQEQFIEAMPVAPLVLVVDNFQSFFNSTNMVSLIEAGDPKYRLIAENAGIDIHDNEVTAMRLAVKLRKDIASKMTPPLPPYKFADVPAGWSVETDLVFVNSGNSVKRRSQDQQISVKQLQRLWKYYSTYWAGLGNVYLHTSVIAGGYERTAERLSDDRIKIGCQFIHRYELEQFALHQSWDFPTQAGG